jgi:hypothetical protein
VRCQLYALVVLVATALRPRPGYWVSQARCISAPPRLPVLLGGGAGLPDPQVPVPGAYEFHEGVVV